MVKYIVGENYVNANGDTLGPVKAAEAEQDLSKLSKDELVKLAEEKGLETDGTKAELVERLEAAE